MIEFTKAFKISSGETFATVEEAQGMELAILGLPDESVQMILKHKGVVIDILTTTATSKPKARRIHGGTKKRKAAVVVPVVVPGGEVA
jgi:hypothetical protein